MKRNALNIKEKLMTSLSLPGWNMTICDPPHKSVIITLLSFEEQIFELHDGLDLAYGKPVTIK